MRDEVGLTPLFEVRAITLTPATLPPGWSPYASPTWPPDCSTIDVIHPDGSVTRGVRYRHWDLLSWPPLGGSLGRDVVGWRLNNGGDRQ